MGIQRSQEDAWTKEMAKHEHRPVLVNGTYIEPIDVANGGKKNAPFAEFPKMLYKAESANGGPRISATILAHSESDELVKRGLGWMLTQEEALADVEARQLEFARLAANRAHNDRWMSDAARAEANAVDEATMEHLPSIPETPIIRRQAKNVQASKAEEAK